MPTEPPELLHAIVIRDVKDEITRRRVARTLAQVTKNVTEEKIHSKMNRLPWTLTRRATSKRAARIAKLLERLGATVDVTPPLPEAVISDVGETQFVSRAEIVAEESTLGPEAPVVLPVPASEVRASADESAERPPDQVQEVLAEALPLRPLSLGEILDRSFQICRAQFWKLFAIAAIPWLATVLTILGMAAIFIMAGLTMKGIGTSNVGALVLLGALLVPSAVVFLSIMFYIGQGALIHGVSSTYLGRSILIGESYRFVMSRVARFLLTSLLFVVVIAGFLVITVALGVAFFFLFRELTPSGWWSAVTWIPLSVIPMYGTIKLLLFDKVVLIEDVAYLSALRRSWSLLSGKAEGNWPRGYLLRLIILLHLFILIYLTISMLFQLPAGIIRLLAPDTAIVVVVLTQVISNLGGLVAGLFSSVCMVVFYYDIRNRKEGFDLTILAERASVSRTL